MQQHAQRKQTNVRRLIGAGNARLRQGEQDAKAALKLRDEVEHAHRRTLAQLASANEQNRSLQEDIQRANAQLAAAQSRQAVRAQMLEEQLGKMETRCRELQGEHDTLTRERARLAEAAQTSSGTIVQLRDAKCR